MKKNKQENFPRWFCYQISVGTSEFHIWIEIEFFVKRVNWHDSCDTRDFCVDFSSIAYDICRRSEIRTVRRMLA